MFEKEAEEIANKKLCSERICYNHCNFNSPKHHRCGEWHRIYKCAKESVEFGYNKANEWHYVKDELPPIKKEYCGRSELVLVLSKEKEMQYAQYVEKEKTWARGICEINFKPYAWKEIVLPEFPKENRKCQEENTQCML